VNASLQGYLDAIEETLRASEGLDESAAEMRAVADLIDGNPALTLAVDDGAVPVASRRALLDELLEGRVRPEVARLVHRAVTVTPASEVTATFRVLASRLAIAGSDTEAEGATEADVPLGRLAARNRVAGYAVAVFEGVTLDELEEVEDQLFRFARTVEANRALRNALSDRDLPVRIRQGVVADLLGTKVLPATAQLAAYAVAGGRARDLVATLDGLVEDAATARGWRVARVHAADVVDADRQRGLGEALGRVTGGPVELQVTLDPQLLGGVVVEVGDLLVDGSARHRLDELKTYLLAAEAKDLLRGREHDDG
jgi:F-type H+-transporting ATPase subunit delta